MLASLARWINGKGQIAWKLFAPFHSEPAWCWTYEDEEIKFLHKPSFLFAGRLITKNQDYKRKESQVMELRFKPD